MHRKAARSTFPKSNKTTTRPSGCCAQAWAMAQCESLEMRRLLAYATPPGALATPGCGCASCRLAAQFQQQQVAALNAPKVVKKAGQGPMIDNGGMSGNPNAYQIGGRWSSTATHGNTAVGTGVTLTYSIVPDGTLVGQNGIPGESISGSNFRAKMDAIYGNMATWLPIVQSVFTSWSAISGITYIYEPNDDGAAWLSAPGQIGFRGDIRMSAHPVDGAFNVLAYNFFPNTGDMVIDSDDLSAGGFMVGTGQQSRALRNVMAHENGHGLGFSHVDPTNNTKLMEAFASTNFDGPQYDDMLAVQRSYGDVYEKQANPNNTAANAVNRGTLADGLDSVQKLAVSTTTDQDWFKFDIATNRSVTVNVTPVGGTYLQGPQNGTTTSFNGSSQANLQVTLFASNGTTQLAIANTNAIGMSETIIGMNLAAGT